MLSRSLNLSSSISIVSSFSASLSIAKRTVFVYTPQSEVLQNNAKYLKYTSPVWVEESDEHWWKKVTELKSPDERPTEIVFPRLFEYYNLECLADPTKLEGYDPATMMTASSPSSTSDDVASGNNSISSNTKASFYRKNRDVEDNHRSWRTKLPFRFAVNEEFEKEARQHNYTQSKYWITVSQVRKQKLQLQRSARPTGVLMDLSTRLLNADQFKNPEKIAKMPTSGYKRRTYGGSFSEYLSADIAANGYKTGLYFTISQLHLIS